MLKERSLVDQMPYMINEKAISVVTAVREVNKFECPSCGRNLKIKVAYINHTRKCNGNTSDIKE